MFAARIRLPGMTRQVIALMAVLCVLLPALAVIPAQAAGPVFINEMLFNPPGTDAPNEYMELRGAASGVIAAGTYFIGIEGDGAGSGDVQTIFDLSGLTFGSGGYLVLLQNGSTYATGAGANVLTSGATGWSGLTFYSADAGATDIENTSVTFLIVQSGTVPTLTDDIDSDNDGAPDGAVYAGWTMLDGISLLDGGASDAGYAPLVYANGGVGLTPPGATVVSTAFTGSYAARVASSTDSAAGDWVVGDSLDGAAPNWSLDAVTTVPVVLAGQALNHIGAANPALPAGTPAVINEFVFNHVGTDTNEYLEVSGGANSDYSGLRLLIIEGDSPVFGVVDRVEAVGVTGSNGIWWSGFVSNALENGTQTILLVSDFTGAVGNDLDADDDGVLDVTPWTALVDSVAVSDGGASDRAYSTVLLNATYDGGSFTPGGASRIPNGVDTDAAADWVRNDFDLAGIPGFTGTLIAGEALNTPDAVNSTTPPDAAPTVSSTTPADNATEVAVDSSITITFSEPVTVTDPWFGIACTTSGAVTAAVSGGPTSYTLDPTSDLALSEICTVTVTAAQVVDQDGAPNALTADYVFDFSTTTAGICSTPFTPIYTLQENGANFGLPGPFSVQGIVTGDFQNDSQLDGFFLQDATGDGNVQTSDGIFVFDDQPVLLDVVVGQRVRVTGTVSEFTPAGASASQTRLTAAQIVDCGDTGTILSVPVTLPFASDTFAERYESMKVYLPQALYVTEVFALGRFGQVVLSAGDTLENPTNEVLPGFQANALEDANDLNRIVLDDGGQRQNPDPTPYMFGPEPTLRDGDRTSMITGILTYMDASPDANTSAEVTGYRIHPTSAVTFTRLNPRPTAPPNAGTLRAVSFNVLNYFNGDGAGGGFPTARGASTSVEFGRQSDKIVAAIQQLNPDVAGLIELENDAGALSAVAELVSRLNAVAGAGTYAYIETGVIGTDAIKVGFIYKPAVLTPVGAAMVDLDAVHNRPPVAQLFEQTATGARFTVVINHFKSKGCDGATGLDLDQGDGQGCYNATRTAQAARLNTFIQTVVIPTSGDQDVLILGDLNAYLKEDPISTLETAGYVNLLTTYVADPYSYIFEGEYGALDQALATASLASQVQDVNEWHINADEPPVLDYNMEFKSDAQDALNVGTPYRSSDHDPIAVDLGVLTPDVGLLNVQLTLEGRANPAPHASHVVSVSVQIEPQGGGVPFFNQDITTSDSGTVTLTSLTPGTYLFTFKGEHTLAREMTLTIAAGVNNATTPLLLEGDASDDNQVNISDFSLLASAFGTQVGDGGYDPRADFNQDGAVNILDFSLLASHFGGIGEGGVIVVP